MGLFGGKRGQERPNGSGPSAAQTGGGGDTVGITFGKRRGMIGKSGKFGVVGEGAFILGKGNTANRNEIFTIQNG